MAGEPAGSRRPRGSSLGDSDVLGRSLFFSGLDAAVRASLQREARTVVLGDGERLWSTGDEAGEIGLVMSGRLKVLCLTGRRQVILEVALPGDVIGEVAMILREKQCTEVISVRRARVLLVNAAAARRALRQSTEAQASALCSLGRRVQRLTRLAEDLSSGDVGSRLAHMLVGLAARVGERLPEGVLIPVRLSRSDLASLSATTPESVSRRLSAWQKMGLLVSQPAGLVVRDLEMLRRLAAGPQAAPPVEAGKAVLQEAG